MATTRTGEGCETCRIVGPLLTAPGASGCDWRCACGTTWHGQREQVSA